MNNKRICRGPATLEQEVAHYLATGDADPLGGAFPGGHALERITGYERHLREALHAAVRRAEEGRQNDPVPPDFEATTWVRRKVEPMISGLFPGAEREVLLGMAEQSVVLLTREATHRAISEVAFLETAWTLANMYLYSLRAPMLGPGNSPIVGLSVETKCYISLEYFAETDLLADYVTHEVAHIFHNCKRRTLGLPHTRRKEWLLNIAFAKRETFAYACETYGRILEKTRGKAERRILLAKCTGYPKPSADRAERAELLSILAEAVEARNGWKHILARCAPPR